MIFYDRSPDFRFEQTFLSRKEREAMLKIWEFSASTSAESLWALADDPDPRISTMALAAAWLQGDPHRLPDFAKRMKDAAPTFPSLNTGSSMLPDPRLSPAEARKKMGYTPQTIGQFTSALMKSFLEHAGNGQDFDRYWAARQGRRACLGWFKVSLVRASQGMITTPPLWEDRMRRVRAVRAEIDQLESP